MTWRFWIYKRHENPPMSCEVMSFSSFTLGMYLSHVLGLANRLTGGWQLFGRSRCRDECIERKTNHEGMGTFVRHTKNPTTTPQAIVVKLRHPYMENAMMVDFHHMKQLLVFCGVLNKGNPRWRLWRWVFVWCAASASKHPNVHSILEASCRVKNGWCYQKIFGKMERLKTYRSGILVKDVGSELV